MAEQSQTDFFCSLYYKTWFYMARFIFINLFIINLYFYLVNLLYLYSQVLGSGFLHQKKRKKKGGLEAVGICKLLTKSALLELTVLNCLDWTEHSFSKKFPSSSLLILMPKWIHVHRFHKQAGMMKFLSAEISLIYKNLHTRSFEHDFMLLYKNTVWKSTTVQMWQLLNTKRIPKTFLNVFI